jgi:hypothetical protein
MITPAQCDAKPIRGFAGGGAFRARIRNGPIAAKTAPMTRLRRHRMVDCRSMITIAPAGEVTDASI